MKKIGVVLSLKPHCGGSYQYWYSILQALSLLDHSEYSLYAIYTDLGWEEIVDGFSIHHLLIHMKRESIFSKMVERLLWKYDTAFLRKFLISLTYDYRNIKRENLDLLLADSSLGIGEVLHIPTVIPIHDLMHRYEKDIEELKEGYEYRENLYRKEVKVASLILVDSELGKKHLIESYQDVESSVGEKARVLPFIPPSYVYEGTEGVKPQIELPEKYIFYPAQFWSHKNHIRLLMAMEKLKSKGIIVNLVLVGSEQNNSTLISDTIKEKKLDENVYILGYVTNEEMVYLYKHARALVMPTLFGPTNIPPLEAFHLGCPVATSRIYAIPNQLGDAAVYFDPRNVDEIEDCIERLWGDDLLCAQLIEKGYKHDELWGINQFSDRLRTIVEDYLED